MLLVARISPAVPELILTKYKGKFKDSVDVAHPEIIHGLKKVRVNKFIEDIKGNTDIKIEFARPAAKPVIGISRKPNGVSTD